MSIRALFYITGDTQQSGFRRIGGSEAFPADSLPYLNNKEPIQEHARVESNGGSSRSGGVLQVLSHVWEYQTGNYGVPVVINTLVAIGTGRAHGFSEYVAGIMPETAADAADAGRLIAAADKFNMLGVEEFMAIPGREMLDCPETVWDVEAVDGYREQDRFECEDEWRKTILSHYWKQASIRAFSEDTPATVRVNLGVFSEDNIQEDTEATIRAAKRFFSTVITPGLPKQVQNIASMAAGVNCADQCQLYTAIEFDIALNLYEEETLRLNSPRDLRAYRLSQAEMEFITEVTGGKTPEVVQKFFDKYKELTEDPELIETKVPFMADYRVWYALYCADRIAREKHSFIEKAGMTREHGNPNRIRDARACFLLIQQLRKLLENEHKLNNGSRRTMVNDLLEDLENGLLQVMLEDMNTAGAESFLLRKNEMVEFHRRTIMTAPDSQVDTMIALAVRDAEVSKTPNFVRCYPATPIRNDAMDVRNGKLLTALLGSVMRRRIDEEKKKEEVEDKYLDQLRSDEFADGWACQSQCVKTKQAISDFLREEIRDPQKHFLLYKISAKYIPENELFRVTMKHFTAQHSTPGNKPEERKMKIAQRGAKMYVSDVGGVDPDCVLAMNRYYQACFREYKANIGSISEDIIKKLGGDTSGAMTLIFTEYTEGTRISAEEAAAVFATFGGENGERISDEVITAYTRMLSTQREKALADPEADRRPLIRWLGGMIEAAPFAIDTSADMTALFNHAANGERMASDETDSIFSTLDREQQYARKESVVAAYSRMISVHQAKILEDPETDREAARENMIRWVTGMVGKAPFKVDTSDSIKAAFDSARTGERMSRATAQMIFDRLMKNATAGEEKVKSAFHSMVRDQLDAALNPETRDTGVLEWIGTMIKESDGHFDYDTTDILKKIFEAAKTGDRMTPSDAGYVFETMAAKAESINSVQRVFNEMLSVRRKEIIENADPDGFDWLCDMIDRSPWKEDKTWLAEQHTENVTVLCEISRIRETPIETNTLSKVRTWIEREELTQQGITKLQKYCNERLEAGDDLSAVETLVQSFGIIEGSCDKLRGLLFENALRKYKEGLDKPDVSFGDLVDSCRGDVERSGKRLDDLYDAAEAETEEFLTRRFDSTTDLASLADEQERIPQNSRFYTRWHDRLGEKVLGQQEDLFNAQPNLEKLIALKSDLISRSGKLQPSLDAAYQLIQGYEARYESLKDKSEYEAITGAGNELKEMQSLLQRAAKVRKTLCSALRSTKFPAVEEARSRSFRHALCVSVMQAMLTDNEREVQGAEGAKVKGCPDWTRVLNAFFPKAELDEAIRKPYDPKNLPVLQRLLSLVDGVQTMAKYGLADAWEADLERTIHSNPDLHRYQSALARNKKMSEQYHLKFDTDGMIFQSA